MGKTSEIISGHHNRTQTGRNKTLNHKPYRHIKNNTSTKNVWANNKLLVNLWY